MEAATQGAGWFVVVRGTALWQHWSFLLAGGTIELWTLTPLRCNDCGADYAWYLPIPARLPLETLNRVLAAEPARVRCPACNTPAAQTQMPFPTA